MAEALMRAAMLTATDFMIRMIWRLATITIWYWGTWALSYVTELRFAFIAAMVIQFAFLFVTPALARRSKLALVRAIFDPKFPTFRGPTTADWAAYEQRRPRSCKNGAFDVNPATGLPTDGPGGLDTHGNSFGSRE